MDPDHKLPILYLIDSIVKNVGGIYKDLFSHQIVNIFVSVFEKVNTITISIYFVSALSKTKKKKNCVKRAVDITFSSVLKKMIQID